MKNDYSFIIPYIEELDNWLFDNCVDENVFFLDSTNKLLCACIMAPHKGTDYKWLLRIANCEGFDKWSSAQIEEFYDSHVNIIDRLKIIDITKKL